MLGPSNVKAFVCNCHWACDDTLVSVCRIFVTVSPLLIITIISLFQKIHPAVSKVADYYKRQGMLDLRKTTMPNIQKKYPENYLTKWVIKLHVEMTLWNDCFFRNMNLYEYIAIFDVDEIAVPKMKPTWQLISRHFPRNKTNYVLLSQVYTFTWSMKFPFLVKYIFWGV